MDEEYELDDGKSNKYYGKYKQDDSVDYIDEYEVKWRCKIKYTVNDKDYDDDDYDADYDDDDQNTTWF